MVYTIINATNDESRYLRKLGLHLPAKPVISAASGKAARYPKVGEKTMLTPPFAPANIGIPASPMTMYNSCEAAPSLAPNMNPQRYVKYSCRENGTGYQGMVSHAPTAVKAAKSGINNRLTLYSKILL